MAKGEKRKAGREGSSPAKCYYGLVTCLHRDCVCTRCIFEELVNQLYNMCVDKQT